jgi:PAT family beta-lactamase induction signal transducer AmpG
MSKPIRYSMFALLYFAQGSIMAYFTALNAMYLLTFGLDMGKVGIIGTIGLIPFVLKVFLGMLSDKVNFFGLGFRKPYIIIGLIIQAVCILVASTINPSQDFGLYAFIVFLMMVGMALYDTCTDGMALDSTSADEQGAIQGFMVGGRAAGMVLTSGLLGLVVHHFSWKAGFSLLSLITLLPIPFTMSFSESTRGANSRFAWKAFRSFKNTHVIALGIFGALYSLIINGANQLVTPFLAEKFSINFSTAGYIAMILGIGTIAGGLIGGVTADKIGQKKTSISAVFIALISIGLIPFISDPWMAWMLALLFGFAFGFYETIYFAISMSISDERIAATMFSILMAVANIGTGIGLGLTGFMSDKSGFKTTFLFIAALNLLAFPLIKTVFRNVKVVEKI